MALVMSLKTDQDFYVGSDRFVVSAIFTPTSFSLVHEATARRFRITDAKAVEILPNVFVSAGEKPEAMIARVAIDAPRELLIIRGDKWRNPPVRHEKAK